jgi:hypothetical protein
MKTDLKQIFTNIKQLTLLLNQVQAIAGLENKTIFQYCDHLLQ